MKKLFLATTTLSSWSDFSLAFHLGSVSKATTFTSLPTAKNVSPPLFLTPSNNVPFFHRREHILLGSGKGFGESTPPKKKKKSTDNIPPGTVVETTTTTTSSSPPPPTPPQKNETSSESIQPTVTSNTQPKKTLNQGQRALEQLRRESAERRDEELRAIREVRSVDEFIKDDPSAAAIPEDVAMRMGQRMIPFVGVPLFGGMAAFVGFWYLSTYKDVEIPTNVVAFSTIAFLAVGLLGITYSVMSASWDPDVQGSGIGIDEFKSNVGSLKEGLGRSQRNLLLREKMAGMPEEDIQRAIRDLERREEEQQQEQQD